MFDWIKDAIYNRNLYRSGKANRSEIRHTAVGWRPDESYAPDPGNKCYDEETGTHSTPSGNEEYYKVVRNGKKE